MILNDPLSRNFIARAVHQTVIETDPDRTGVWCCELYAVTGAGVLYLLTGWRFEAVAGFAWRTPEFAPVHHASGLPLDAPRPSWAHLVRREPEPAAHAWVENRALDQVVDLSLRPVVWNTRDRLNGHVFRRDDRDTRLLQEKYADLPHLVAAITRRVTELAAPAVLARANGESGHVLGRIAARWPEVADRLLEEANSEL